MLAKNTSVYWIHGDSFWDYSMFACLVCAKQQSYIFAGNWSLDYSCLHILIDYLLPNHEKDITQE